MAVWTGLKLYRQVCGFRGQVRQLLGLIGDLAASGSGFGLVEVLNVTRQTRAAQVFRQHRDIDRLCPCPSGCTGGNDRCLHVRARTTVTTTYSWGIALLRERMPTVPFFKLDDAPLLRLL